MSVSWTLSCAGTTKSLAAWGIRTRDLSYRLLDEDNFIFAISGDITTDCPFAYGQAVKLSRAGLCVFIGTVTAVVAEGDARSQLWIVTCSNVWWQLARTMFQQPMAAYTGGGGCAKTLLNTTKVVLFSDPATGQAISTGQQIRNVGAAAAAAGIVVGIATVPEFVNCPFEPARDLMLADVIRRSLVLTPDAVSWVDYSSGAPVINFQQRALLEAVTLDAGAGADLIESISLQARHDMVPAGVRFNFITQKICPPDPGSGCAPNAEGNTQQVSVISQDDAGAVNLAGSLVSTVDLTALDATTTETVPIGLAGQYYASLLLPMWEGAIVTRELECSGTVRPGNVVNLSNGHADWAAMAAVVQQVQCDLLAGETRIIVGPPQHLAPQDFVTLVLLTRNRAWLTNAFAATRAPGTPETPNCLAGLDPDAAAELARAKANAAQLARNIDGGVGGSEHNLTNAQVGNGIFEKTIDGCDPDTGAPASITVYGPP